MCVCVPRGRVESDSLELVLVHLLNYTFINFPHSPKTGALLATHCHIHSTGRIGVTVLCRVPWENGERTEKTLERNRPPNLSERKLSFLHAATSKSSGELNIVPFRRRRPSCAPLPDQSNTLCLPLFYAVLRCLGLSLARIESCTNTDTECRSVGLEWIPTTGGVHRTCRNILPNGGNINDTLDDKRIHPFKD